MNNTNLVICAIFKNEGLYLKEWIDFHKKIGVSKFYLYNNLSSDNYLDILKPYIDEGVVDLTEWAIPSPAFLSVNNPQLKAYQHFINRINREKIWAAFIDFDEFLFSPTNNVLSLLNGFINPLAIGVNWMCFGSSDKNDYENIPVLERFTWRPLENIQINTHIKSIIRMDQNVQILGQPHFFNVEHGTFNENMVKINGPFSPHSSGILRINHYVTKSKNEWLTRQKKGKADNAAHPINWNNYNSVQEKFVIDKTILSI
jgi:hypothetical protein